MGVIHLHVVRIGNTNASYRICMIDGIEKVLLETADAVSNVGTHVDPPKIRQAAKFLLRACGFLEIKLHLH